MASLANSSMIPEAALLVFYPEPMPACGTQGPYCRKIYHSIHLHPLWIINDFTDLSFSYFFPKLSICIAIVSLYIETILNLLLNFFLPLLCSLFFLSGLSKMGRIAKMWASLEQVEGLKMALCLNNFFFSNYLLHCFPFLLLLQIKVSF